MGSGTMSTQDVKTYYDAHKHISSASNAREVFKSNSMNPLFDPSQIRLPRESCDSLDNPNSRGIIFAEDVTGSMGSILLDLIRNQFPKLIEATHKNLSFNPHIMFMGIGDVAARDDAPLQVTQFEADIRMVEQLQQIWLEEGGGGNGSESYALAWYFAGKHVKMDCFNKRKQKGFLFTFGDDGPTPRLTRRELKLVFGDNLSPEERDISGKECLKLAEEKFYCYHVILDEYPRGYGEWRKLMGNRVIHLSNHRALAELITTILRLYEGDTKTEALERISDSYIRGVVDDALIEHEESVDVPELHDFGAEIEVF